MIPSTARTAGSQGELSNQETVNAYIIFGKGLHGTNTVTMDHNTMRATCTVKITFVFAFMYWVGFCRVLGSINMEISYHLEHILYVLTSIKDATRLIAENGFDSRLVCAGILVKCGTGAGLSQSTSVLPSHDHSYSAPYSFTFYKRRCIILAIDRVVT